MRDTSCQKVTKRKCIKCSVDNSQLWYQVGTRFFCYNCFNVKFRGGDSVAHLSGVVAIKCPFFAGGGRGCIERHCALYSGETGNCCFKDIATSLGKEVFVVEGNGGKVEEKAEQTQGELIELRSAMDRISGDVFDLKSMVGRMKKRVFTSGNETNKK